MNGYLLDTNAALLLIARPTAVAANARASLVAPRGYVSQVCAIELAIKHSLGKLNLPPLFRSDFARAFRDMANELEADILPIELRHIDRLSRLPFFHRDPFDRLIISQSLEDDLQLVTRDRIFAAYPGLSLIQI